MLRLVFTSDMKCTVESQDSIRFLMLRNCSSRIFSSLCNEYELNIQGLEFSRLADGYAALFRVTPHDARALHS